MRPESELVTQMALYNSCQKLYSLSQFNFENLQCLLIIVRSGQVLMLALARTFEETDETLATKLDIAINQCCT